MSERLSPAKINLMLRVLGQRPDGYHDIQTCFKILPWGDWMRFEKEDNASCEVVISGFTNIPQEDNLIHRAADLLKPKALNPSRVHIEVDKVIPAGGGLGGGSSNAATTLKVLNQTWDCRLSQQQLMDMSLSLGADVPVFIAGFDALATGVGEQLVPCEFNLKHVLLLFPDCHVITAEVFNHPNLKRDQTAVTSLQAQDPTHWINDCLDVVLETQPEVRQVYRTLSDHYSVYMSGTGSTLFAVFEDLSQANEAKKMAQSVCPCHLLSL